MIKVENVSKIFRIPSEKRQSLKMKIINVFNRTTYTNFIALENVNLEIKKGEFVGIIGKNGSGKSTLLKLITGIYPPTAGRISVAGEISAFLELGVGFNEELSARDNIYLYGAILGLTRKQISKKFNEIIRFAGLEQFVNMKLKSFSSGMQVRLAFSTAIQADAGIFLVDEVLAVGDADFQKKCYDVFERFKREGKTILFVSHDLETVKKFCDRLILIDNGKILEDGETSRIITKYLELLK
jgi:ABC-type polysaccharide/polyol phosphate transport system ATPase subunit